MKARFTTGEWKANYIKDECVGFSNNHQEIYHIFQDYRCIEFDNQNDVRLIELAPLLAERIMEDYVKVDNLWFQVEGCHESPDDCGCDQHRGKQDYLLDELAKLYEGNTDES